MIPIGIEDFEGDSRCFDALAYKGTWAVFSNRESGDGYSDILVEMEEEETGGDRGEVCR